MLIFKSAEARKPIPRMENTFDPDLIHAIFKLVWSKKTPPERERNEDVEVLDIEAGGGTSKKNRPTTGISILPIDGRQLVLYANSSALKLSCELLRTFVAEGVQRAAVIAEVEGNSTIEATHFERILPQLLLDF